MRQRINFYIAACAARSPAEHDKFVRFDRDCFPPRPNMVAAKSQRALCDGRSICARFDHDAGSFDPAPLARASCGILSFNRVDIGGLTGAARIATTTSSGAGFGHGSVLIGARPRDFRAFRKQQP